MHAYEDATKANQQGQNKIYGAPARINRKHHERYGEKRAGVAGRHGAGSKRLERRRETKHFERSRTIREILNNRGQYAARQDESQKHLSRDEYSLPIGVSGLEYKNGHAYDHQVGQSIGQKNAKSVQNTASAPEAVNGIEEREIELHHRVPKRLALNERHETHEAGALYGVGKTALMLGADAGVFRIDYLGLSRGKTLQHLDVLIVDILYVLGAEKALFGHVFSR
jgi:hypothetical protein